jgi:hypothetical protein
MINSIIILFGGTPRAIKNLDTEQFEDLRQRCAICTILGGQKNCSCTSLETFVRLTGLSIAQLLKWYKKNSKKFSKKS